MGFSVVDWLAKTVQRNMTFSQIFLLIFLVQVQLGAIRPSIIITIEFHLPLVIIHAK